ncbi:BYS1domainprotein [Diplodia corticola]|uniref:BYS1domainprotein n=1 Tax=Diplodia corticola TaxID=236234 RepID=A0A1J9RU17_9PEZI|nr:BYS1domainprotein [Diplodia corticola]OJD31356.1 BYS1domainprotein [Diplodia corticola]
MKLLPLPPFLPLLTTTLPLLPLILFTPTPTTATLTGTLINNCPYPIYAKTTRGNGYDSHELARISPAGGRYRAAVAAHPDGPGVTIKAQRAPDPAWRVVYQVEYAQSGRPDARWGGGSAGGTGGTGGGTGDWVWFDLSTVDGSPFGGEWRRAEVWGWGGGGAGGKGGGGGWERREACGVLECAPGEGACEWPVPERGTMGDCRAGRRAEVVVELCGGGNGTVAGAEGSATTSTASAAAAGSASAAAAATPHGGQRHGGSSSARKKVASSFAVGTPLVDGGARRTGSAAAAAAAAATHPGDQRHGGSSSARKKVPSTFTVGTHMAVGGARRTGGTAAPFGTPPAGG